MRLFGIFYEELCFLHSFESPKRRNRSEGEAELHILAKQMLGESGKAEKRISAIRTAQVIIAVIRKIQYVFSVITFTKIAEPPFSRQPGYLL